MRRHMRAGMTIGRGRGSWTLLAVWFFFLHGQSASIAADELTVDSIYGQRRFDTASVSVRFLKGFEGSVQLLRSEEFANSRDIVQVDIESRKRKILVAARDLVPEGRKEPLSIESFAFSKDQSRLLIYTNSRRVWRINSRGDYWVYNRNDRTLRQLGADRPSSSLMFAKFSPDGRRVGYVHRGDVYVEDVESGNVIRLTHSPSEEITQGTFDWVYEEEFRLRDGWRWSPDGLRIAFWKIDSSRVNRFPLVDTSKGLYPSLKWIPYPKVGTKNPTCSIGVVTVDGGETVWLDLPDAGEDFYVARMEWIPGQSRLFLQRFNRLQNTNRVLLGDPETGQCSQLFVERDEAWLDVHDEIKWLSEGRFTWISERSGWRHLYVGNLNSGELRQVTSGEWDMIRLLAVDEALERAYFTASPNHAARRFLYEIGLDGTGLRRVTPESERGDHSYRFSEDSRYAVHTASSLGHPPVTELVRMPGHETVRVLQDQKRLIDRLGQLELKLPEFIQVETADGITVDAWKIIPPDFDPRKNYPLLVYVYGEPAGQTVRDRWGGQNYLWHQMLAARGYVVMSFDNRGTPAPKGRAWRKSVYRRVGVLAPRDQAAAVKAMLDQSPWIDRSRVGVWGWSGGGSMSLNAIFKFPDLYRTAIAIAPVPDQHYYDTIYQERYMGLPSENESGFREGSPIHFANQLQGNLLLIHGTGDDNCHYQTTELLINELIRHDKQFTMFAYPNRSHSIREGQNTTRHLRKLMTSYLLNHLPTASTGVSD